MARRVKSSSRRTTITRRIREQRKERERLQVILERSRTEQLILMTKRAEKKRNKKLITFVLIVGFIIFFTGWFGFVPDRSNEGIIEDEPIVTVPEIVENVTDTPDAIDRVSDLFATFVPIFLLVIVLTVGFSLLRGTMRF